MAEWSIATVLKTVRVVPSGVRIPFRPKTLKFFFYKNNIPAWRNGRRSGLKIHGLWRVGSSPAAGMAAVAEWMMQWIVNPSP